MMKRFCIFFLIALTLNYWLPIAAAQGLEETVAEEAVEAPFVAENPFPAAGPKIEGPWLWMIAPTSEPGGEVAALSGTDYLAEASGGSVTEQQVATNGITAGEAVGDRVWTLGTLAPTGGDNISQMLYTIGFGGDIDHHVAYGFIILDSPREQNTRMYVGSDDGVRVWLNGIMVHNHPFNRGAEGYRESFQITLKEGKNTLFVAVYEWKFAWSGFFGFSKDAVYSTPFLPVPVSIDAAERPPMYWTDNGGIYALVGTEVRRFAPSVNNAMSLAIDDSSGKLYWTEQTRGVGAISSANLDGSGVTRVTSTLTPAIGVAVDTVGSKLYWTTAGGSIQRANLDGSNLENVVENQLAPADIAIADGNIYWTQLDGAVRFMNLNGEKVIHDLSPGTGDLSGPVSLSGVDIGAGKVYWTQQTTQTRGTLNSANLDGTDVKQLRDEALWGVPIGIAVDTAKSKLYWTDAVGRIQRANLDGSGIQNVVRGLGAPIKIVINTRITAPPPTPTPPPTTSKYDVNADGTVDIMDVEVVFAALCSENPPATPGKLDVTGDGQLTIHDLVAVSQNIEASKAAAAPARHAKLTDLQIDRIQEQIHLLQAMNDRSLGVQRTLAYLQSILAAARPEKTQLLANYPNPFNPETWIPYELATDTNVRITIYNAQGMVIRTLQLGQQAAGYYTERQRAAYWDGRNALGEQVASGIYFYQLETDEMSSLRKMVILK